MRWTSWSIPRTRSYAGSPSGRHPARRRLSVIAKKLDLKEPDLRKAAKSGDIGLPKAAKGNLEGFLYPATYDFGPDVTAESALRDMVKRGQQTYDELGIPDKELRRVVIEASLLEAEAGTEKYMGKVARVIENRIKSNTALQFDSTVSYATGKFNVTTSDATAATRARTTRTTTRGCRPARSATRGRPRSRRRSTRRRASGCTSSPRTRAPGRPSSPTTSRSTRST